MEFFWCVFNFLDVFLENSFCDWKIFKGLNIYSVGGDSGGLEVGVVGFVSCVGEKVIISIGDGMVVVVFVVVVMYFNGVSYSYGGEG